MRIVTPDQKGVMHIERADELALITRYTPDNLWHMISVAKAMHVPKIIIIANEEQAEMLSEKGFDHKADVVVMEMSL